MIEPGKKVLVTGATGVVGSALAVRVLREGGRVAALQRDASVRSARERLQQAFLRLGEDPRLIDRVEIVLGDLGRPDLGIVWGATHLQGVSSIVHCAAGINFNPASRDELLRTNVEGTRRILSLAECLRVPLVHLSTAYVCGNRTGRVREDELFVGQSFRNGYESSKCTAEQIVRQWSKTTGLPAMILRPGILVGRSDNGRIQCFNTVYQFMHVLHGLSRKSSPRRLRLPGDDASTLNLLPVDTFTDWAWAVMRTRIPRTYHLTHPHPIPMGQLRSLFHVLFPNAEIQLIPPDDYARLEVSREEEWLAKAVSHYLPYMRREPSFDTSHSEWIRDKEGIRPPAMDLPLLRRLHDYALSVNFGRSRLGAGLPADASPSRGVQEYFSEFLSQKLHQSLLPNLRKLSARFRIVLREHASQHWALSIEEGVLTGISQNGHAPQCTFVLPEPVFLNIVAGRLSPQQAFFQKQIDIEGDMEKGLTLAAVLSEFFMKFPYPGGRS